MAANGGRPPDAQGGFRAAGPRGAGSVGAAAARRRVRENWGGRGRRQDDFPFPPAEAPRKSHLPDGNALRAKVGSLVCAGVYLGGFERGRWEGRG